jgi:hypothetical protein
MDQDNEPIEWDHSTKSSLYEKLMESRQTVTALWKENKAMERQLQAIPTVFVFSASFTDADGDEPTLYSITAKDKKAAEPILWFKSEIDNKNPHYRHMYDRLYKVLDYCFPDECASFVPTIPCDECDKRFLHYASILNGTTAANPVKNIEYCRGKTYTNNEPVKIVFMPSQQELFEAKRVLTQKKEIN